MSKAARVAVALHLYYDDAWPKLAPYIRNISPPFDLFITYPRGRDTASAALKQYRKAKAIEVDNVGRDVLPFLDLLPELTNYDAVCKIHSKKDPKWARQMLEGVAGSRPLTHHIVEAFRNDPKLGLVGAREIFYFGATNTVGRTRHYLTKVLGALPPDFGFFAGTMFWVRPAFVAHFPGYFPRDTFVPHNDVDGYPEHVLERMFGVEMARFGRRIGLVDSAHRLTLVPGTYSAAMLMS